MEITIKISDVVIDIFKENLWNYEENPKLVKTLIKRYLNDSIDREDLDMYVAQYLDDLDESGEMNDIVYESTLE